jgi:hypothetical protein
MPCRGRPPPLLHADEHPGGKLADRRPGAALQRDRSLKVAFSSSSLVTTCTWL